MERTKPEIKRDFEYLLRLWESIRELTLQSSAPALIYEEANLIKRSIRDLYTKDIDEVIVEGEDGYRDAQRLHAHADAEPRQQGQLYRRADPAVLPLSGGSASSTRFIARRASCGRAAISSSTRPRRWSPSTSIPGRSTRERNIEETALKTNLEAAEEIARQLRLRDLAGLIVIDFIDMEDARNNARSNAASKRR